MSRRIIWAIYLAHKEEESSTENFGGKIGRKGNA
jgi:hypothetical protein